MRRGEKVTQRRAWGPGPLLILSAGKDERAGCPTDARRARSRVSFAALRMTMLEAPGAELSSVPCRS